MYKYSLHRLNGDKMAQQKNPITKLRNIPIRLKWIGTGHMATMNEHMEKGRKKRNTIARLKRILFEFLMV